MRTRRIRLLPLLRHSCRTSQGQWRRVRHLYLLLFLAVCIRSFFVRNLFPTRSKAWEHKERLLRFDRDFARRTVILDDQADFFTTNWLTEEERIAAEEKQAQQKEKLRTREKQTLDITF